LSSLRKYNYIYVYSNPPLLPYIAYLANKLYGVKIIYILYDIYPEMALYTNTINEKSLIYKVMLYINKKVYERLTALVVISEDMKSFILNNRDIQALKVHVIENWYHKIDIENNLANNAIDKFEKLKKDDRFKLAYTGNLGVAQDSDLIIEFIRRNQNSDKISFIISGHGSKMEDLKHLNNYLSFDNLYLFDYLHEKEFEKLLVLSDAFLLSLKKELSGLAAPSKIYTYLSAGKPIVAIIDNNSYLAKFITNENIGLIGDINNHSGLINQIINLKNNYLKYTEICKNAIELFNKFYETNIATDKYIKLMEDVEEYSYER
jgi:glycosyltransferase involved in cell wall biosynthesis